MCRVTIWDLQTKIIMFNQNLALVGPKFAQKVLQNGTSPSSRGDLLTLARTESTGSPLELELVPLWSTFWSISPLVSPFWSSKNGTNRSSKRGYRYNVSHHKETGETRCTGTSGKIREVPVQRVSPGSFPWMIFYSSI